MTSAKGKKNVKKQKKKSRVWGSAQQKQRKRREFREGFGDLRRDPCALPALTPPQFLVLFGTSAQDVVTELCLPKTLPSV